MIIVYLTCTDQAEATNISAALLESRLIACSRMMPVSSSYWWQNKIDHSEEMLLMMESVEEKFNAIEKMVAQLHSYDEFVLTAVPVLRTTPGVESWLKASLADEFTEA